MRTLILLLSLLGLVQTASAADINGQLKRADLENLSADPSLKSTGRVYFNTSGAKAKYWSGAAWLTVVDTTNTLLNGAVQNPMVSLGDLIYGASAGTPTALSGNTTSTKKFLTQTGTGTLSAVPAWGTVSDADLPVTLSGHTLATPTLSSYGDLTEQGSAPSSPASSTLRVYAKTDDKLYTLNPSGVETAVGSGSGEKNYLSKGTSTNAGWTASGAGVTCTTVTSGLPDATVGTALAVTGVSGSTAYCFANFDLDQADFNKKMKLAFDQAPVSGYATNDQRADVYSCTVAWSGSPATTCSGTATRLPLSTDSSSVSALPNLTGTYRTTWDSPGSAAAHIQVRVGLNAATTHQNNLAQIVAGPGVVTQGAVATGWYASTAPGGGWINTGPTNVTTTVSEQRTGSSVFLDYSITATGASAAFTSLVLNLPNGYALDPSYLPLTSSGTVAFERLGEGQIFRSGSNSGNLFAVNNGTSTTSILVYYEAGTYPDIRTNVTNSAPVTWTNVSAVTYLHVRTKLLPIASMAGSGTVNLAQSDISYYYGTGGTWGTSATITTAQGQGGVLGGTTTPGGAFFSYTFTPTTPVPVGAVPQLQISSDAIHWSNVGGVQATGPFVENLRNDGTNYIGASASLNNSGQITVYFGKYAAGTATAWSGTWYWRVAVGLPGQAVGFGAATRSALGLVYGSNSKARAHLGTNQSCGATSTCVVLYDTKNGTYDFDTNGELDVTTNKGRFTATSSGYYHVHCTATVDSAATTDGDSINVYKNGQRLGGGLWTGSTNLTFAADDTVLLNGTTDYVDCRVYNGNVSSRSIDSNANDPGTTVIQVIQLQ